MMRRRKKGNEWDVRPPEQQKMVNCDFTSSFPMVSIVSERVFMLYYYSDVGYCAAMESGETHSLLFE